MQGAWGNRFSAKTLKAAKNIFQTQAKQVSEKSVKIIHGNIDRFSNLPTNQQALIISSGIGAHPRFV